MRRNQALGKQRAGERAEQLPTPPGKHAGVGVDVVLIDPLDLMIGVKASGPR